MNRHLISLMIFFPFAGAVLQAFLPSFKEVSSRNMGKWIALVASLLAGISGFAAVLSMQTQMADPQLVESFPWVGSYAINYEMAIDGFSAPIVLLISLVFPVIMASEWDQKLGLRGVHGLFLLLQSAFLGATCSQDLFLQFFFWAFSALPFYFLIGIWGGAQRESAAFRSMVTACIGNALLFAALVLIYYSVDPHTFLVRELAGGKLNGKVFEFMGTSISVPGAAFLLVSTGLALRAPLWPLHGWYTQVAEQAPPAVLVVISGVVVPVATSIFLRLTYSLFPETLLAAAPAIIMIGALNLLMGGICALAQKGLRSLLAFASLTQMGMVLLGAGSLNPAGLVGAVYEQLVMGLGLAGLGLFAGLVIQRAGHATFISDADEKPFGGIATRAPMAAVATGVVVASLLGFPGLGGFVGNALVLIGSFASLPPVVLLAGAVLLLSAYCFFTVYRHLFLGKPGTTIKGFDDLSLRERAYLLPIVFGLLALGIYPKPLLDLVRPTALTLLSTLK